MLDSIYYMTLNIFFAITFFIMCKSLDFAIIMRLCYGHYFITLHLPENL